MYVFMYVNYICMYVNYIFLHVCKLYMYVNFVCICTYPLSFLAVCFEFKIQNKKNNPNWNKIDLSVANMKNFKFIFWPLAKK